MGSVSLDTIIMIGRIGLIVVKAVIDIVSALR